MALDSTAREANVRDSIKKYLVDSLATIEGISLGFDVSLSVPDTVSRHTIRWVSCDFGPIDRETLSSAVIDIYCCTRNDSEGFRLAQLVDTVLGYLTDINSTDGMKKITFYRSSASETWTSIGGLVVQEIIESGQMIGPDETKFKVLNVKWRFASKI